MDDKEFRKTNVNVACVLKMDLNAVGGFKEELLLLIKKSGGDIIYHTVSPYKLIITEDKRESNKVA